MKKSSAFLHRNLSIVLLVMTYLLMVVIHIISDSFLLKEQGELLLTMLPFFAVGSIIDYILARRQDVDKSLKVFAKLCPAFIFLMQGITSAYIILEQKPPELFDYLIWLILALPFFIASYDKKEHKHKLIYSGIGTGLVVLTYLFLTTQTDELNEGYGAVIYFITYFLLLYTASGNVKLPYLGMVLGLINAAAYLWLRYQPITEAARLHGWDYELYIMVDLLILITLCISILLRLLEEVLVRKRAIEE